MAYDFFAIGDTAVDAFIRIKDAKVNCDIDNTNCMISFRFGDKIPYESADIVAGVGNSANAAVAASRLRLQTGLRAYIGVDKDGDSCLESWRANGVDTTHIVREAGKKTNYHYALWYESERTILIKHEDYTYRVPELSPAPKWVYLSSLGHGTEEYHKEIGLYLSQHPETKLAFQPGTFQIQLGIEGLHDIYSHTELFICNKEEAKRILETEEKDMKILLGAINSYGPQYVVITDGREGSYARDKDGRMWHAPMYPDPGPPVERTGAGDATASTTTSYLMQGYPLDEAVLRGHINSMSVVQYVGAQKGLLTPEQIEDWYAKRPPEFKAADL